MRKILYESQFFLPPPFPGCEWPPTTTSQTREVGVRNGKPVFYKPDKLLKAEQLLKDMLRPWVPEAPITNHPVRLCVSWCFPIKGKHRNGEYKLTRPDTDNLQKLLKDCMTQLGFWVDDSLVCSEQIDKFWAEKPGIFIRIEEAEA